MYDGYYQVRVTVNGKSIGVDKVVNFKIGKKVIKAITNKNGYAKIKLNFKPNKYTITTTYGNVKKSTKVTIQHALKAKNLKTKKSAKQLKITVTLNKLYKKALKNKKITLKFRGKTYTAKTNKNGIATFTINKNTLQKLKIGKKYTYTVKYGNDNLNKKITIQR